MQALGDYALVPVGRKERLWMTYSGTDWRVARYPAESFALWEPQPGRLCASLPALYSQANVVVCSNPGISQVLGGGLAKKSIRAMPVADKALVRRSHPISQLKTKNSQINHEQSWIVCKEWIRPVLAAATRPMRCQSR